MSSLDHPDQQTLGPDQLSSFCLFAPLLDADFTGTSLALDSYSKYSNAPEAVRYHKPAKPHQITLKWTDKAQLKGVKRHLSRPPTHILLVPSEEKN